MSVSLVDDNAGRSFPLRHGGEGGYKPISVEDTLWSQVWGIYSEHGFILGLCCTSPDSFCHALKGEVGGEQKKSFSFNLRFIFTLSPLEAEEPASYHQANLAFNDSTLVCQ